MKVYLFLYPIKEFVEMELDWRYLALRGRDPKRINKIIDYRYRRRGFKIVWLQFSQSRWLHCPDRNRTSEIFEILPQDLEIGCGVSFKDHVANWHYPDLNYVFSQLPNPIDELVLGGFHQADCVDKTAAFAHGKGISVRVDEDTTQHFFSTTAIGGNIPLNRRGPDIYGSLCKFDPYWIRIVRKARKGKPWLDPVEPR